MSIIGHPFATSAVLAAGTALHLSTVRDAGRTLLIVTVLGLLPIAVLMIRQVRKGSWENVDASNRSERPILFKVGVISLIALITYALIFQPHSFLIHGGVGVMAMLAVCAVATRWVKVSLHMAFCTLATTTLMLIGSPAAWFLLALVPALAWSRLALNRHSKLEVACGLLIGLLTGVAIYRL